jgi:hypothetical protein
LTLAKMRAPAGTDPGEHAFGDASPGEVDARRVRLRGPIGVDREEAAGGIGA